MRANKFVIRTNLVTAAIKKMGHKATPYFLSKIGIANSEVNRMLKTPIV
ncbi:MAG: hypothetical protein HQ463_07995 [Bacteroidetes bacterium]|nr:hypothetical protein [Bacteroidota bacterium]